MTTNGMQHESRSNLSNMEENRLIMTFGVVYWNILIIMKPLYSMKGILFHIHYFFVI